jgi:hypothetical protein
MGAFGLVQGLGWAMGPFLGALVFTPLKTHPLVLWCVLASGAVLATVGFAGMAIPRRHATQNDTHGPA